MAVGIVSHVIWPPWRFNNILKIEEYVCEHNLEKTFHSRVMSNDDIYQKYGRPKYNQNEIENSEIPGWTKGY